MASVQKINKSRREITQIYKDRCKLHDRHELEQMRDATRRGRVAAKRHERIINANLKAVGVDPKKIASEHEKERAHVKKLLKRQAREIQKENREVYKRHMQTLKTLAARKDVMEHHVGNPHLAFCDWSALGLSFQRSNFGIASNVTRNGPTYTAGRDGYNEWEIEMSGQSLPFGAFQQSWDLATDFVWPAPPEGGLMTAATLVSAIGFSEAIPLQFTCAPTARSRVIVTARLEIWQRQGIWLQITAPGGVTLIDRDLVAPTGGGFQIQIVGSGTDAEAFLTVGNFPIIAGSPVILRVWISLSMSGQNGGEATVDFMGGRNRFNIPAAWISHVTV